MKQQSQLRSIQIKAQQAKKICIDIGSTQTRVSSDGKIIWQQPTCLAVHPESGVVTMIGEVAYRLLGKRTAKNQLIFPIEQAAISSMPHAVEYVRAIREQLGWKTWLGGMNQPTVYCGLYDSLSPLEKSQFKRCFSEAGWTKVVFHSAALAALQAGKRSSPDSPQCIIDIGGQSTELAVAHGNQVLSSSRVIWGGLRITDAIQRLIKNKYHCAVSWHTAEQVKRELGFITATEVPRTRRQKKYSIAGKDITSQLGKTVVVEAEAVIEAIAELPAELITYIQHFFADLPAEIVTNCLEQGVVLSGGGAQLAGVGEYLRHQLKTEVHVSAKPESDILDGLENMAAQSNG